MHLAEPGGRDAGRGVVQLDPDVAGAFAPREGERPGLAFGAADFQKGRAGVGGQASM